MRLLSQERGGVDPLLIPLVVSLVFVFGLAGFSIWSYSQYLSYRDEAQPKIDEAVELAEASLQRKLESEFLEREKNPLKSYKSSAALGSISVGYPKTWGAYVDESGGDTKPLDGYFHPNYVPSIKSKTAKAVRLQVVGNDYETTLKSYESEVKQAKLTASALELSGVTGIRLDGEIRKDVVGSLVLLPLRDKTLMLWTESTTFRPDFDTIILKNFTFTP